MMMIPTILELTTRAHSYSETGIHTVKAAENLKLGLLQAA